MKLVDIIVFIHLIPKPVYLLFLVRGKQLFILVSFWQVALPSDRKSGDISVFSHGREKKHRSQRAYIERRRSGRIQKPLVTDKPGTSEQTLEYPGVDNLVINDNQVPDDNHSPQSPLNMSAGSVTQQANVTYQGVDITTLIKQQMEFLQLHADYNAPEVSTVQENLAAPLLPAKYLQLQVLLYKKVFGKNIGNLTSTNHRKNLANDPHMTPASNSRTIPQSDDLNTPAMNPINRPQAKHKTQPTSNNHAYPTSRTHGHPHAQPHGLKYLRLKP